MGNELSLKGQCAGPVEGGRESIGWIDAASVRMQPGRGGWSRLSRKSASHQKRCCAKDRNPRIVCAVAATSDRTD